MPETDLTGLIARVREASGPDRAIDVAIEAWLYRNGGSPYDRFNQVPWFTASLDAITALIEQKLPGWHISIFGNHMTAAKGGKGWRVQLQSPEKAKPDALGYRWPKINAECFYAPTAPLALCLAFLMAIQSEKNDADH